jgi:hypothetical protein
VISAYEERLANEPEVKPALPVKKGGTVGLFNQFKTSY